MMPQERKNTIIQESKEEGLQWEPHGAGAGERTVPIIFQYSFCLMKHMEPRS